MTNRIAAALGAAVLALGLCAGAAKAHEGHDDDARTPSMGAAPRGTSNADALELVAVARDGTLTVFLDRIDSNEPVTDAVIEAETPEGTVRAVPTPDGSYRLDAALERERPAPTRCISP